MTKILFVHHAIGWGGAPKAMINLINELDKSKYEIKVLLIKDSVVSEKLQENNIKYSVAKSLFYQKFYFGFIHSEAGYYKWYQIYYLLKSTMFWLLSRFYFAKKELENHDYDIVHLNSSIMTDWLAPAKAKGKTVIHIREPFRRGKFDLLYHLFISQMRKYADRVIAISHDNASRINLTSKTDVVYDYADSKELAPDTHSCNLKSVLYLGGAAEIKGFHQMVESLQYLDPEIKVLFGGSYKIYENNHGWRSIFKVFNNANRRIRKSLEIMRLSPNAIEIGLVYDVADYLNRVACLVSPFAKPHFALPVIEAFFQHKPVIVTSVIGASEVVKDKHNGLLVEVNDAQGLADAIKYICNNPEHGRDMGEKGYNDAMDSYTKENMNKIAQIYEYLIKR